MNCNEVRRQIVPYVDGELDEAGSRSMADHIAGCAGCTRRVAFERNFNRMLSEGIREVEVPRGVLTRVRRSLAAEASGGWSLGRWLWHPLTAYATAATLMVALVLPAAFGNATGLAGWRTFLSASPTTVSGRLVCIECERARATAEEQRACRRFDHRTGVRTEDDHQWSLVNRGPGAELIRRPELRGTIVHLTGAAYLQIETFDVQGFELG